MNAFSDQPVSAMSRDGKRLHLRHGPIELLIEADGPADEVAAAYRQAERAFKVVLPELAGELDLLRKPVAPKNTMPEGMIARRMFVAASAHAGRFVTPMVAVAGGVADHILTTMTSGRKLARAFVNNGGDIALHLSPGETYRTGICCNADTGAIAGMISINAGDGIGGIATSGWRGRSHSLGIADAVTVLACDAVTADAAATIIANQVTLESSPAIDRLPANEISPDSDLGGRLVTVAVGRLGRAEIDEALDRGNQAAKTTIDDGLIHAAFLSLDGQLRVAGGGKFVKPGDANA